MEPLIVPEPESALAACADYLCVPLMYVLQGNLREVPQRTHVWNNKKLPSIPKSMDWSLCVHVQAVVNSTPRYWYVLPLFHMPVFGGWSEYVVLEPAKPYQKWYVGWVAEDVVGYSQIALQTPVRMLMGAGPFYFFATDSYGYQLPLQRKAVGSIGQSVSFANLPLL